jgi:hypothetical protein
MFKYPKKPPICEVAKVLQGLYSHGKKVEKSYSQDAHSRIPHWREYVPPKHWYLPTSLHGITTQKTNTDIFITVRTSDLTPIDYFIKKVKLHCSRYSGVLCNHSRSLF